MTARRRIRTDEVRAVPSGKVKWYDEAKGFGFLSQESGEDVYCPASALPKGVSGLKPGMRVEFGIAQGRRGDQALQVRILEPTASVSKAMRRKPADMVTIIEDLYRLLEGIERGYRADRHPDPKTAAPTAKLLRALADELEL
jgi:CspA family cold shock protein